VNKWGRQVTRVVLAVTDGLHVGRQISVDVRGSTAKLLIKAAESGRHVTFDVFVRRRDDGREFSQVNLETIRWVNDVAVEPTPGLPAHVRAMRDSAPVNTPIGTTPVPRRPLTAQDIAAAAAPFEYGFACIGSKDATRTVIPWAEVYASMAACTDPSVIGKPVFLSMHVFTDDFVTHVRDHKTPGSTAGYRGSAYSPLLAFDIDRKDEAGQPTPEVAHQDTLSLLVVLLELQVPHECISVGFSGLKGFHIEVPSSLCGAMPSGDFPAIAGKFCSMIAAEAGVEIDANLYRILQPLRAPNSRHEVSGLYKVPMTVVEFLDLSPAEMQQLAARPRAVVPPVLVHDPIPVLAELWSHAERLVAGPPPRSEREIGGGGDDASIFAATWEFLFRGAPEGERAVALFRAAANLADFESRDDLIRALLDRGVTRSGLAPTEAAAHIDSALRRAAEARPLELIDPRSQI